MTQKRQAVGVQDPLKLAHHLEVLGGTAALVDVINSKHTETGMCSQQCNDLTEETER